MKHYEVILVMTVKAEPLGEDKEGVKKEESAEIKAEPEADVKTEVSDTHRDEQSTTRYIRRD